MPRLDPMSGLLVPEDGDLIRAGDVVRIDGRIIGVSGGAYAGDWVACGCEGYATCTAHRAIAHLTQIIAHDSGPSDRARALGLVARLAVYLGAREGDTMGALIQDAKDADEVAHVIER